MADFAAYPGAAVEWSIGLGFGAYCGLGSGVDAAMNDQRAFGSYLGSRFGLTDAPRVHVTHSMASGELAVTELVSDVPTANPSERVAPDEAFLVGLQVGHSEHEIWFDGKPAPSRHFLPGQTCFYDFRRDPAAYMPAPYHSLQFYMPLSALNLIAHQNDGRRIDDLEYRLGEAVDDPIIGHLGRAITPAFDLPAGVSGLFLDHVLQALCAHVASAYGQVVMRAAPAGLAGWQESLAKEIMDSRLSEPLTLTEMASACGLSVSHFTRSFRLTTGSPPHRWLLGRRVERAKGLLARSGLPLGQIALECGFADQSHFSRIFRRATGASPGAWRRQYGVAARRLR